MKLLSFRNLLWVVMVQSLPLYFALSGGVWAGSDEVLVCAASSSETGIECDVVADNVRVEYYNINRGTCDTYIFPDEAILKDRGIFFELGIDGRSQVLDRLGRIGSAMPDSSKTMGFDYTLPVMSMNIPEAASALNELYDYSLSNGYTMGDYITPKLQDFTLQDADAIGLYLGNMVLGDYTFGQHFSVYSGCKILEFGVFANGQAFKWVNY